MSWTIWSSLLLSAALTTAAQATELSGIIIYDTDHRGLPTGRAWHTSLDPGAAPMDLAPSIPPGSFNLRRLNGADGEISIPLEPGPAWPYQPGKYLFTAFWQPDPGKGLSIVTVNFFFNRDTLHPGISAVVPVWPGAGFTYFRRNDAPTLLALYLRGVDNAADLQYTDATNRVTLTALLISNPSLYVPVDRVGAENLAADHAWDATAIIELTVAPDVSAAPAGRGPVTGGLVSPRLQWPQQAIVGPAVPGTSPGDSSAAGRLFSESERGAGAPSPSAESTESEEVTTPTPQSGSRTPSPRRTPAATKSPAATTPTPRATVVPTASPGVTPSVVRSPRRGRI